MFTGGPCAWRPLERSIGVVSENDNRLKLLPAYLEVEINFVEAEIDLAFAFLHLAEHAISVGNGARATELIDKAAAGYKAGLACLEGLPSEFKNG